MKKTYWKRRVCVLAGGGSDSSVLVAQRLALGWEVHPLYVRSGFIWESAELYWLRRFLRGLRSPRLKPLVVVEAPMGSIIPGHWGLSGRGVPATGSSWDSVYLPGRNLVLLSQAAVYCGRADIGLVEMAVLKGNPFRDAQPRFLKMMGRASGEALGRPIRFSAPYRLLSKERVLALVPDFPTELTFSCLRPKGLRHCGACSKCEERLMVIGPSPRS
jgi:7-cyano-7-deazaguanine synthase